LIGKHEIGWRLRPESWRQGIAKEAAIASFNVAFDRLRAPQVIATTLYGNVESQGLMKRLGMTRREDLDYTDTRFGPEMNPSIVYVMDAADWPSARAAALR
jgi:RimJ/RimL family protein N-acetyltransferase